MRPSTSSCKKSCSRRLSSNYYEILGVAPNATAEEIHAAYRARARALHPDLIGDGTAQQRQMQLVNEAFDVLGDHLARREYDRASQGFHLPTMWGLEGPEPPPGFSIYLPSGWSMPGWRYRAADAQRGALSLMAATTDLSGLRDVADDGLWKLVLTRLRIIDSDLALLERFVALEELLAGRTKITDEGLLHLRALPKLRVLDLAYCAVTDAGVPALRAMEALEELSLFGTKVGDGGARELAFHPNLRVVDLRRTEIDGECLPALATIPHLRELRVPRDLRHHEHAFTELRPDVTLLYP